MYIYNTRTKIRPALNATTDGQVIIILTTTTTKVGWLQLSANLRKPHKGGDNILPHSPATGLRNVVKADSTKQLVCAIYATE